MNPIDDNDLELSSIEPDNPQRLLILAYTRLFLLPEREGGWKLTAIAAFGRFEVRLIEFQDPRLGSLAPLWVELYDRLAAQVLDSCGCRDLLDAGGATESLVADAQRLSGLATSGQARSA
jgi:hypothetical protein